MVHQKSFSQRQHIPSRFSLSWRGISPTHHRRVGGGGYCTVKCMLCKSLLCIFMRHCQLLCVGDVSLTGAVRQAVTCSVQRNGRWHSRREHLLHLLLLLLSLPLSRKKLEGSEGGEGKEQGWLSCIFTFTRGMRVFCLHLCSDYRAALSWDVPHPMYGGFSGLSPRNPAIVSFRTDI